MAVGIEDHQTTTRTCTQSELVEIAPGVFKSVCIAWKTTINDTPATMSGYYLWRSLSSTPVNITKGGRSTGQQSIDAYTASLSIGSNAVSSVTSGYWSNAVNSADNVAHPAWIFTLTSGQKVAVDAFTGQRL